ncbi:MAG: hypothetical protein HYX84_09040 [Chloroflexi bacterium]|nr:hypothetical protein [Chloroflexota bacterium]
MTQQGFRPKLTYVTNLAAIRQKNGVPDEYASCHTAIIDGYVVEGHVPIEAVSKLLTERPDIDGIALPGMVEGAPGMDGVLTKPITVYALSNGTATEFMTFNPR